MCGLATYKLTWEEIVALYRLTLDQPPLGRTPRRQPRSKSKMSKITKNTRATLHQLVAGEDTMKEEGRLGDLVLRYISLSSSQRPEYFIMIGQVEYLPKQIERWARDFGLI
jgi:hypothetical protein